MLHHTSNSRFQYQGYSYITNILSHVVKYTNIIIAERLSTRQLNSASHLVCIGMFVCMSVTLRNANFLCAAVC